MERVKFALVVLGSLFGLFVVPTLVFLAKGNQVAAAITATLSACTLFGLTLVAAFGAGAWYTRAAMTTGAGIALKAQETNDRWDERKTAAFGRLFQEGARVARQERGGDMPALPPPSHIVDWIPPVAAFADLSEAADDGWDD